MELLGWLNAGSLVTQNAAAAAAGLPSIDDGEEEEEEPKSAAAANFASPSATPSLRSPIRTIPPAEHEYSFGQ